VSATRTFALKILKASWGIAIDLSARAICSASTEGAVQVVSRTWLRILTPLPEADAHFLLLGLKRVAPSIEAACPEDPIIIEVQRIDYAPTDYQPEAMAAAMIGRALEEIDFEVPPIDVSFDHERNRYVFVY